MNKTLKTYQSPTLTQYGSVEGLTAGLPIQPEKECGGSDNLAQCICYPGEPGCTPCDPE
jgi:hypothetical protein